MFSGISHIPINPNHLLGHNGTKFIFIVIVIILIHSLQTLRIKSVLSIESVLITKSILSLFISSFARFTILSLCLGQEHIGTENHQEHREEYPVYFHYYIGKCMYLVLTVVSH